MGQEICRLAREYYTQGIPRTVLEADCIVPPEMLTVSNVDSLAQLEPCGNGCPKPLLVTQQMILERFSTVGNGRHVRLRLRSGRHTLHGIWFSAAAELAGLVPGEVVDIAYLPQINDFRNERTVQLNIQDMRPYCAAECAMDTADYLQIRSGNIDAETANRITPDRNTLGLIWRYLAAAPDGILHESAECLCRKIVRKTNAPLSLSRLLVCLDIFSDVGLLEIQHQHKHITLRLIPTDQKADLSQSRTMQALTAAKES